jgi:TRAP-type C4-dicarboxylate transport system permease small subunit
MLNKVLAIILFIFYSVLVITSANIVLAEDYNFIDNSGLKETGIKTGHTDDGKIKRDIDMTIGTVIQSALSFLGVVFLILMIYGGFLWMTAQGNEFMDDRAGKRRAGRQGKKFDYRGGNWFNYSSIRLRD